MSDAGKTCRACKQLKPLSLFYHQRFPQRVTASCLDCRNTRRSAATALSTPPATAPPALPQTSPTPPLTALPTPATSAPEPSPALPAPAAPSNFVTRADLTASLGELRQFLQDEVLHAVQTLAAAAPQPQPVVAASLNHPAHLSLPTAPSAPASQPVGPQQQPALPAHIGEYQPAITYPWVSAELVEKVSNDSLTIYELPKLASVGNQHAKAATDGGKLPK